VFKKILFPTPPENNVVILDEITHCNHLIIKTTLVGEGRGGEGRETKKMQKVHVKMENVPRILSKIVATM